MKGDGLFMFIVLYSINVLIAKVCFCEPFLLLKFKCYGRKWFVYIAVVFKSMVFDRNTNEKGKCILLYVVMPHWIMSFFGQIKIRAFGI